MNKKKDGCVENYDVNCPIKRTEATNLTYSWLTQIVDGTEKHIRSQSYEKINDINDYIGCQQNISHSFTTHVKSIVVACLLSK